MNFAEGLQFGVCFLIVGSKLLETALVVPMEMSSDHLVVMYGENIAATLVVVSFKESNPSCHSIPGQLVLAEDGATGPLSADLLDASIKGGILTFKGSVVDWDPREVSKNLVSVFHVDVEELPIDQVRCAVALKVSLQ
jgi:hypothetical protein